MSEWYHYVMVYGMWTVLALLAVGGLINPFRRRKGRR